MDKWSKIIGIVFGVSTLLFAVPAILAIWGVVDHETGWRAAGTLGVIFIVLIICAHLVSTLEKKK